MDVENLAASFDIRRDHKQGYRVGGEPRLVIFSRDLGVIVSCLA